MRFEYYDHDTSAWWKVFDGDVCLYVIECLFVSRIINVLLLDDGCYVAFDITAIANDLPEELIEELKYALATNKWRRK
jgi:hypothetical protein